VRRLAPLVAAAAFLAGCGGGGHTRTVTRTVVQHTEVVKPITTTGGKGFDPAAIYQRISPGVVTVISVFPGSSLSQLLGGSGEQEGLGSGFVVDRKGDIATNAHVVTTGSALTRAKSVYVQFGDGNQVQAQIVGADANADVALIRVSPAGLSLRPLSFGNSDAAIVGEPVAAIGSPFGEPQSLSVGVISGLNRTIDALNKFKISNAIQTDAAINHGNSGGPLVDARGRVIGINSQIQSTGGGGEGVGFAVPGTSVKNSVDQLRAKGRVDYAFLGITSIALFPQLAHKLGLPVGHGALVRDVTGGGPASKAQIKAGSKDVTFEGASYKVGGDVITAVDGRRLGTQADLSQAIAGKQPGDEVTLTIYRGSKRLEVKVRLGTRPAGGK
jgi:S1-C subfamily serine protease